MHLDDVKSIYPSNGTQSSIMKALPKLGRVFVARLRKDAVWGELVDQYKACAGPETSFGPELH